jgi:hypothetical protein
VSPNQLLWTKPLSDVLILLEAKLVIQSTYLSAVELNSCSCVVFSKFPVDSALATQVFQKVSIAYDVLSNPTSKRLYDSRSPSSSYDIYATRPAGHADDTFRGVVIAVFNDFLDGDIEVIRSMLSAFILLCGVYVSFG